MEELEYILGTENYYYLDFETLTRDRKAAKRFTPKQAKDMQIKMQKEFINLQIEEL